MASAVLSLSRLGQPNCCTSSPSTSQSTPYPVRLRFSASPRLNRRIKPARLNKLTYGCSITNTEVLDPGCIAQEVQEEFSASAVGPVPIVHIKANVLETESLTQLAEDNYVDDLLTTLPVLSEEEHDAISATPAHPAGL